MFVGARPWQILYDQPTLRAAPEIRPPVSSSIIRDEYNDAIILFEFLPQWKELPKFIQRIGAAVAVDMATVNLIRSPTMLDPRANRNLEVTAGLIEQLMRLIIDNPEHTLGSLRDRLPNAIDQIRVPDRQPYEAVYTALNFLLNDWLESAILRAISSFQCYEPVGPLGPYERPLGPHDDLEDYLRDYEFTTYSFVDPDLARDVQACMTPWFNIWWQEVLNTLAFRMPEGGVG